MHAENTLRKRQLILFTELGHNFAKGQYKFGIIGRIVYCQTLYAVDRCRMLDTETALDRAVDTDLVPLITSPTANWSGWAKQAILSVSIRSTESSVLSSMRSSLPHGCSSAELDAELDSDGNFTEKADFMFDALSVMTYDTLSPMPKVVITSSYLS